MKDTSLVILACICLIGGASYTFGYEARGLAEREIRTNDNVVSQDYAFHSIAKQLANENTYDVVNYNCVNFSNTLVDRLTEMGYEARVVTGWMSDQRYCKIGGEEYLEGIPFSTAKDAECLTAHAWVEVVLSIEATSGRIVKVGEI